MSTVAIGVRCTYVTHQSEQGVEVCSDIQDMHCPHRGSRGRSLSSNHRCGLARHPFVAPHEHLWNETSKGRYCSQCWLFERKPT